MRIVAAILLALCALVARAENFDLYQFENAEQEARFDALIEELRCPKCQNQNLADSNAPIARDLRERTYELVREGRSDEEIVNYLRDRYGDFITYRPPLNAVTLLLWAGPFLLLVVVGTVLLLRVRKRAATAGAAIDRPDPGQVQDILRRYADRPAQGPGAGDGPDAGNGKEPRA